MSKNFDRLTTDSPRTFWQVRRGWYKTMIVYLSSTQQKVRGSQRS